MEDEIFDRAAARAGLRGFLAGRITATRLIDWAELMHTRDDVDLEAGHEDLLARFLVQISTPEIFWPITPELCERWLEELGREEER